MTIDDLTFDASGLTLESDDPGRRMWRGPANVLTLVNFYPEPPDWPFDATDAEAWAAFCVDEFGAVLSSSIGSVAGHQALQCLSVFRARPTDTGLTYMAVALIPFPDAWYRVRIIAWEVGTTGHRESMTSILSSQNPSFPARFDDELYDTMFPDHPLSLVRARFPELLGTLAIKSAVAGDAARAGRAG